VVLSFACTLGISILFIRFVVGDAGFDASIPTFAFIFLVALGIDYTIFLMARVREESRKHGTREGMPEGDRGNGAGHHRAPASSWPALLVLMTLPVTFTFDLGFMVALGILLDTFIVRTIMVPAAVELIATRSGGRRRPRVAAACCTRTPASRLCGNPPRPASGPSRPACASRRRPRSPRGSPLSRSTTRAARSARAPCSGVRRE